MAKGFRTGGRPPGGRNKATIARERALKAAAAAAGIGLVEAFSGDALALLTCVYKDPNIPLDIRIEAAKAAIRYERAPLAPITPAAEPEELEAKAQRLHEMISEMRETVGGDRSNVMAFPS